MPANPLAPYSRVVSDAAALVVLGSGMSICFSADEFHVLGEWRGKGVEGHPGLIGLWEHKGVHVLLALGRRHLYEGYAPEAAAALVDGAGRLGLRRVVLTNAAGGLNPLLRKGDLVLHSDYIGTLLGDKRLRGKPEDETACAADGIRRRGSVDSTPALDLYPAILQKGAEKGIAFREGVYAGVIGPSYETRAEIRMLRRMGADLVGMSTIVEAEAASRRGMELVGFSLVTNTASDTVRANVAHNEVTEASAFAASRVRRAIEACVEAGA